MFASGSYDMTVKIWNVSDGRVLHTMDGYRNTVYCVAFSPDGKTLASGSFDRTVQLWDVSAGR